MAAPRARMTYGGGPIPTSLPATDAAARQELFSVSDGGHPRAGPGPYAPPGPRGPVSRQELEYMNNRQVMDYAVDTHKETTAATRRALQVVEQTKELQATTMASLQDQGQQMRRVAQGMDRVSAVGRGGGAGASRRGAARAALHAPPHAHAPSPAPTLTRTPHPPPPALFPSQIGTDVTYSQRILRYMQMCCCLGFFCSCCTEPGREQEDRNWRAGCAGGEPGRGGRGARRRGWHGGRSGARCAARGSGGGPGSKQPPHASAHLTRLHTLRPPPPPAAAATPARRPARTRRRRALARPRAAAPRPCGGRGSSSSSSSSSSGPAAARRRRSTPPSACRAWPRRGTASRRASSRTRRSCRTPTSTRSRRGWST
jgi:hypothetical protein